MIVVACFVVFALSFNSNSGIFSFKDSTKKVSISNIKNELLNLAKRGLNISPQQQEKIVTLFNSLERMNPNKDSLKSYKLSGLWNLEYTSRKTSKDSVLGLIGAKSVGPTLQFLDIENLKATNSETRVVFGFQIPNSVTAVITPLTNTKVINIIKKQ